MSQYGKSTPRLGPFGMRVANANEMRAIDRAAIEDWGFDGLLLMENAALGVVDAIADTYPAADSAVIFCGPGNNGGDGLAVARHLDIRGYRVRVVMVGWSANKSADAAWQHEVCTRQGVPMVRVETEAELQELEAGDADVWVDALFGIGLGRPLSGIFAMLAEQTDHAPCPVVAVDLPSGLDASSGEIPGPSVCADLTVTFAVPKWPHVFAPAADRCGQVVVADLGLPPAILAEAPGWLFISSPQELESLLLVRSERSHKGNFGHGLLVAGSVGMSGAAILATQAAVAGGAGLVTVAVPSEILVTLECASLESMSLGLETGSAQEVLAALKSRDVLALGPGLGTREETIEAVREIVGESDCPAVLDADALNALVGAEDLLRARTAPTIVTPHPGEAARLAGVTVEVVEKDRVSFVRRVALDWGCTVVLKGHQTLVATTEGNVTINTTGNPGMASGGCGDVLTGLILALLAQGYAADVAAILGVYLHGLAGDLALESRGEEGLRAGDIVEALPQAFEVVRST
jgi:hydroxyethylthiazole kinase-like uncharacterized protein yjeF